MNRPIMSFGLENIIAQDSHAFFHELTAAIEICRNAKDEKEVFDKQGKEILNVIKKNTGLTFKYRQDFKVDGYSFDIVSVQFMVLNINNIFDSQDMKKELEPIFADGIKNYLQKSKKNEIKGKIDLKNGRVEGDFTKLTTWLIIPAKTLLRGELDTIVLSSAEVAAILLHEIGHVFTYLEYSCKVADTNVFLSSILAARKSADVNAINIAYKYVQDELKLSGPQLELLKQTKEEQSVALQIVNFVVDKVQSEIGYNPFSRSNCEHIADQFAARQGAYKELLNALNKITSQNGYNFEMKKEETVFMRIGQVIGNTLLSPLLTIIALMAYCDGKKYNAHGSDHLRFTRLRNELVNLLKNDKLDKERVADLNAAIKVADNIIATREDDLNVLEKFAYVLCSNFRADYKFEVLQRDLERLANNKLFEHAAALRTQ